MDKKYLLCYKIKKIDDNKLLLLHWYSRLGNLKNAKIQLGYLKYMHL